MNRVTSLELYPDDSILYIYDAELDFASNLNFSTPWIWTQGFSGHPRSYKFFTLGECFNLRVEVWCADLADPQQEILLRSDTIRAVMVPFSHNPQSGVMVSHALRLLELRLFDLPSQAALVFEIKLRDDAEYINSSQYQEYTESGFTQECCRLTFYPREELVLPQILRADTFESPPTFNRYTPVVATTEPLILHDEPTQEVPW